MPQHEAITARPASYVVIAWAPSIMPATARRLGKEGGRCGVDTISYLCCQLLRDDQLRYIPCHVPVRMGMCKRAWLSKSRIKHPTSSLPRRKFTPAFAHHTPKPCQTLTTSSQRSANSYQSKAVWKQIFSHGYASHTPGFLDSPFGVDGCWLVLLGLPRHDNHLFM